MPLGPLSFRAGLASALEGALAAGLTAHLASTLLRRLDVAHGASWGAVAGILAGGSYALAFQSVRPEVYSLSCALVVAAAVCLERFDASGDLRWMALGALACGLALGNHHLLALTFAVPAIVLVAVRVVFPSGDRASERWARSARAAALGLGAGALGLAVYAYLPLRASRHPTIDWGAATTLDRLYWTISAQAFHKTLAKGAVTASSDVAPVLLALMEQLHPVGLVLALGGLYVLVRGRASRGVGLLLGASVVTCAATPVLLGFDRTNPDQYGYLAAAVALLAVLAVVLPAVVTAQFVRSHAARSAVALLFLGGAIAQGASARARIDLSGFHDVEEVLTPWIEAQPPRSLVVTSDFQSIFALWSLRELDGLRPDLTVVHRHFLAYPGYREEIVARHPWLAPLVGTRDIDTTALTARTSPTFVEYDLDLDERLLSRSGAVGGEPPAASTLEAQTRRFLAWRAFLSTHRACRAHDTEALAASRARAIELVGAETPELALLSEACASGRVPSVTELFGGVPDAGKLRGGEAR